MTGMTGTESKVQSRVGVGAEVKLTGQGRKRGPPESRKAQQNEGPSLAHGKAEPQSGLLTGAPRGTDAWNRTRPTLRSVRVRPAVMEQCAGTEPE